MSESRRDLPDSFYYSVAAAPIYSSTPEGELDVNKMVQGEPCWQTPYFHTVRKPKNLIIADWTVRNWSRFKRYQFRVVIEELRERGFSLYVWDKGVVEPLEQGDNNTEFLYIHRKAAYELDVVHPNAIIAKAVAQQHLIRDQVKILDYHWIDYLLDDALLVDRPRVLRLSDYRLADTEGMKKHIISILRQSEPPLANICVDEFFSGKPMWTHLEREDKLMTLLPQDFRYVTLDLGRCYASFAVNTGVRALTKLPNIKEVTLKNYNKQALLEYLTEDGSIRAEDLTISGKDPIEINEINYLLSRFCSLKSLEFSNQNLVDDQASLDVASLSGLQQFAFKNGKVTAGHLHSILATAQGLKSLVSRATTVVGDFEFKARELEKLEDLFLVNIEINSKNVTSLLNQAKALERVTILAHKVIEERLQLNDSAMQNVKLLELGGLTLSNVQLLVEHAPKLKSLNLNSCYGKLPVAIIPLLSQLHALRLHRYSITQEELSLLLNGLPNLKVLDLFSCGKNEAEKRIQLNPLALKKLETLKISKLFPRFLKREDCIAILAQATNIKKLVLQQNLTVGEVKFNQLTKLELTGDEITIETLRYYMSAAPGLQQVIIYDTPKLRNFTDTDEFRQLITRGIFVRNSPDSAKKRHVIPETKMIPFRDPLHDPRKYLTTKPKDKNQPFEYKGLHNNRSQGMIIEKLSQYFTLTNRYLDYIPKIQDGICAALSQLFKESSPISWSKFIAELQAWDGTKEKITTRLSKSFATLRDYIERYQFNQDQPKFYLGSLAFNWLHKSKKECVLINPWHRIAVKPILQDDQAHSWLVYDPNFLEGVRQVAVSDLSETLKDCLGDLIAVDDPLAVHVKLQIKNLDQFIADGGILTLIYNEDRQVILEMLQKEKISSYPLEALEGLLLRSTCARPAWLVAYLHDQRRSIFSFLSLGIWPVVKPLVTEFILRNEDYHARLLQSLEALSSVERNQAIVILKKEFLTEMAQREKITAKMKSLVVEHKQSSLSSTAKLAGLQPIPIEELMKDKYFAALTTWDDASQRSSKRLLQLHEYAQRHLLQFKKADILNSYAHYLQHVAYQAQRPVFYVNTARDLMCSLPWVECGKDGVGILRDGPGGALYDFLMANKDKNPLLIVNYDNFSASDIVRFNSLIDDVPSADGTPLPKGTTIIGLVNTNNPDCYQGADFSSRFQKKTKLTISLDEIQPLIPSVPVIDVTDAKMQNPYVIDLFKATNWKSRLLGSWKMHGKKLVYIEGLLVAACKAAAAGQPLEIRNGLWHLREFQLFWQQACVQGMIPYQQQAIILPKNFQIIKSEGYQWELLSKQVKLYPGILQKDVAVLNPKNFSQYFEMAEFHAHDNTLHASLGGLIAKYKDKSLTINLTRALSDEQWAELLDHAKNFNVRLQIYYAKDVALPAELAHRILKSSESKAPEARLHTRVIVSNEADIVIEHLRREKSVSWKVIDVSECTIADLLLRTTYNKDVSGQYYEFKQIPQVLLSALARNENIILTGRFTSDLADGLAGLLLQRLTQAQEDGCLILLSSDEVLWSYTTPEKFIVTSEMKQECIRDQKIIPEKAGIIQDSDSLAQARARALYHQLSKEVPLLDASPWQGLKKLSPLPASVAKQIDFKHSDVLAAKFSAERLQAVNAILKYAPYVFLAGQTGIGKSTFVQKEFLAQLAREPLPGKLHQGVGQMKAWASARGLVRNVLFLDEANLDQRDWSEFEGLYNDPPGIVIEGEYYPLTKNHKVIFAGNPLSYSDDRRLAKLFEQHGNAILFKPLSLEYIYQRILLPIFANTLIMPHVQMVSEIILKAYQFILTQGSQAEVRITPRELEMMALMIVSRATTMAGSMTKDQVITLAKRCVWQMGEKLLPDYQKISFKQLFSAAQPVEEKKAVRLDATDYLLTPSRQQAARLLDDLMMLREWRRAKFSKLTESQRFGGLGGIVLEADPAGGKSDLVVARLRANGFEEAHYPMSSAAKNTFYRIPVSMSLKIKTAILLQAFDEGAVVVIDEINSSGMMEQLLNSLLMGRTLEGTRPTQAGFMIIGTQNPVTLAGRNRPSQALARRLITECLPPYSYHELIDILLAKNVSSKKAEHLVTVYMDRLQYATDHHLSPQPTLRDVLHLVKKHQPIASAESLLSGSLSSPTAVLGGQVRVVGSSLFHSVMDLIDATPAPVVRRVAAVDIQKDRF
jgi:hypothetical protein